VKAGTVLCARAIKPLNALVVTEPINSPTLRDYTERRCRKHGPANPHTLAEANCISSIRLALNVKREHTSWGARKIRERLIRRFSGIKIPAKSTIHAVLDRHGLVKRRGRSRRRAQGTALSRKTNWLRKERRIYARAGTPTSGRATV
jgi:hypothetical protein